MTDNFVGGTDLAAVAGKSWEGQVQVSPGATAVAITVWPATVL